MSERVPPGEWSVRLSWPPSVNNLFPHKPQGGRVMRFPSTQYRQWRKEAAARIALARLPGMAAPVWLDMALTPPDKRHRDATNYAKAVEDALVDAKVLAGDDARYVHGVRLWWAGAPSREGAGVMVRIRLAPAQANGVMA